MATGSLSITYSDFTPGTVISSSEIDTDFDEIMSYINNRNDGTDEWQILKVTGTISNPVVITGNQSRTEVSIDNTATDGDPQLTFKLSGTAVWSIGVDDGDSDALCITAAATMTGTNYLRISSSLTSFGVQSVAVTRTAAAATVLFYTENVDNTSTSSHAEILAATGGTAGGDPLLHWNIPGGSPADWCMGPDNSAGDILTLSRSSAIGTNNVFTVNSASILSFTNAALHADGTVSAPGIAFVNDADCGWYRVGTNDIALAVNGAVMYDVVAASHLWYTAGTPRLNLDATQLFPESDNAVGLGKTGKRYIDVWAVNGTIQTSVRFSKKNIVELLKDDIKIPKPIFFQRPLDSHPSKQCGFEADSLPPECFAIIDSNGNRSSEDVYTSAVIGMLCAAAREDYKRINNLEARILAFESK